MAGGERPEKKINQVRFPPIIFLATRSQKNFGAQIKGEGRVKKGDHTNGEEGDNIWMLQILLHINFASELVHGFDPRDQIFGIHFEEFFDRTFSTVVDTGINNSEPAFGDFVLKVFVRKIPNVKKFSPCE
jgi:hypothetical protein